jgi:hypothetical protein
MKIYINHDPGRDRQRIYRKDFPIRTHAQWVTHTWQCWDEAQFNLYVGTDPIGNEITNSKHSQKKLMKPRWDLILQPHLDTSWCSPHFSVQFGRESLTANDSSVAETSFIRDHNDWKTPRMQQTNFSKLNFIRIIPGVVNLMGLAFSPFQFTNVAECHLISVTSDRVFDFAALMFAVSYPWHSSRHCEWQVYCNLGCGHQQAKLANWLQYRSKCSRHSPATPTQTASCSELLHQDPLPAHLIRNFLTFVTTLQDLILGHINPSKIFTLYKQKQTNSMVWVREWTIPTERPPLIGEVIANFCV